MKIRDRNTESAVFGRLAQKMAAMGFDFPSAGAVMDEIARVAPSYAGVSYDRLESESRVVLRTGLESPKPTQMLYAGREYRGLQWPVSEDTGSDTPVLYQESFPLGKANLIAPEFRVPEYMTDPDYPLWLVPGRVLLQRDRETRVELEQGSRRNRIVSGRVGRAQRY